MIFHSYVSLPKGSRTVRLIIFLVPTPAPGPTWLVGFCYDVLSQSSSMTSQLAKLLSCLLASGGILSAPTSQHSSPQHCFKGHLTWYLTSFLAWIAAPNQAFLPCLALPTPQDPRQVHPRWFPNQHGMA